MWLKQAKEHDVEQEKLREMETELTDVKAKIKAMKTKVPTIECTPCCASLQLRLPQITPSLMHA